MQKRLACVATQFLLSMHFVSLLLLEDPYEAQMLLRQVLQEGRLYLPSCLEEEWHENRKISIDAEMKNLSEPFQMEGVEWYQKMRQTMVEVSLQERWMEEPSSDHCSRHKDNPSRLTCISDRDKSIWISLHLLKSMFSLLLNIDQSTNPVDNFVTSPNGTAVISLRRQSSLSFPLQHRTLTFIVMEPKRRR